MSIINTTLDNLRNQSRLRSIPPVSSARVMDLSSNDYLSLGMAGNEFKEEFFSRFPDVLFSSSASRLLSIHQEYHIALENYLESLYGRPALLFNSGYHANVGCIGAIAANSTLFVCDRLIHASVIDGLKMSGAKFKRFPHNDMVALNEILKNNYSNGSTIVVVVESIYSMDGDETPLEEIIALKKIYPGVMIYLDEAHAFGVRGRKGLGLAEEKNLINDIDIIIGTLGKAAASVGAFLISSVEMKSYMINLARPFIFSTALPPVNTAWSRLMIEKIIGLEKERKHLETLSSYFRMRLENITGCPSQSTSQIIPWITGDAGEALRIAARLREAGIVALPIRRPTVPPGGERIRFSLSSGMNEDDFDSLFNILENI